MPGEAPPVDELPADDDDDPGLLEQVAEVMGDLRDDANGMVT